MTIGYSMMDILIVRKSKKTALLHCLLLLCFCFKAYAQEEQVEVKAEKAAEKPKTESTEEYPWLDSMHDGIATSVKSSAVWFDDFFALDQHYNREEAQGEARIRLGWEPRSRDLTELETRVKIRVKLPNLKNRADLVLSDYDDDRGNNDIRASGNNDFVERNRFSLALRWRSSPESGFSHRIGVGRRLQAFVKSRYRNLHNLSDKVNLRWQTAAYVYSSDGFGADFSWQLAYNESYRSIYRWNNQFYFRDHTNDWLWSHSVQKLTQFNEKNALIAGFYIEGLSRPNYHLDEYLVSLRWRKNTMRKWLFYEIEPFVLWRRDEDFAPSYGIALRLEGYFGEH